MLPFYDLPYKVQPQADTAVSSAVAATGAPEPLEGAPGLLRGESVAPVAHLETRGRAR